jgi:hypothetical protein
MLTSLVAVIPGAVLAYLLVIGMLFSESLPMMAYVMMGGTLLAATITVLLPAGILVGGGRRSAEKKPSKSAKSAKAAAAVDTGSEIDALDDEVEVVSESIEGSDDSSVEMGTSEFDLGDSFDTNDSVIDEDEVETEHVEEFEGFDIDEDEVEEIDFDDEPKPKKKKK